MKRRNIWIAATSAALLAGAAVSSPALADCNVDSEPFFVHKADTTSHAIVTDSKGCDLDFTTDKVTKFRSATITRTPANGKLVKIAALEFAYHPKPGFKGRDAFTMRICGSSPAGRGCSTLNYTTEVN